MTVLARIADRVLNRPLLIEPSKLSIIASALAGRLGLDVFDIRGEGEQADQPLIASGSGYRPNSSGDAKLFRQTDKGIAIVPVIGSLVNRGAYLNAASGLTSYETLRHQIAAATSDKTVPSIILDIDSPGGEAIGAFEVADAVREACKSKVVIAVVNGMAASAAYAIASAATQIVTSKSSVLGSIGVVLLHFDHSHALHDRGIKPTLIHAGTRKVDGNPYQPLTDDVKAELKSEVETFQNLFVDCVAKNRRGLSKKAIRATEARTYIGEAAVRVGLADAIGTFEAALAMLGRGAAKGSSSPAVSLLQVALSAEEARTADVDRVTRILDEGQRLGLVASARSLAALPATIMSTTDAIKLLQDLTFQAADDPTCEGCIVRFGARRPSKLISA